jgi:predicted RNA-binding protein YlqC (UPF0109 family)
MTAERVHDGAPIKRLIETIVKRLSDHPAETRVIEMQEGRGALYEIAVPEGDRGRLIGREGRTVRALRAFVGAAAAVRGRKVNIRIRD